MIPRIPPKLITGLAFAVGLDTIVQLIWKTAVIDLPDASAPLLMVEAALRQPLFLLVGGLMAGQFVNWMLLLKSSDLSYVHAITATSYATVAAASVAVLGERLDVVQVLGIGLILVGVLLASRTGHLTERCNEESPS